MAPAPAPAPAVVWSPTCAEHYAGAGHPERPQRIIAVLDALRGLPLHPARLPDPAGTLRWIDGRVPPRAALEC
ncbi:MAG: hypothetical protein ACREME_06860, partial [Gemmatimonadales bacterium]